MRVVFVSPAGSVLSNLSESGLDRDGQDAAVVLAWNGIPGAQGTKVISVGQDSGTRRRRVVAFLTRSALGRNILRLSPLDGGRRMWRAVRRDPAAVEALTSADLIVAVERDAILTAWKSARSLASRRCAAVYGMPAGRAIISAQAQGSDLTR